LLSTGLLPPGTVIPDMQRTGRTLLAALVAASGVVLAVSFGVVAGRGEAAVDTAPANASAPTISGQPVVGEFLTASRGTWTGTEPIQYVYQWQRCDQASGACANISGGTQQIYTVSSADLRATLRVQVTAANADGTASAASTPTGAVVPAEANVTGCPPVQEAGPLSLDQINPPARLLIDRKTITPSVITRSTRKITLRFHVVACDGRTVRGALVHATPTPYQQFSETEKPTGADGWASLTMTRLRFFPVSPRQQLLVVFARARKPGDDLLGGVSTRRLFSFRVRLG
jgi:hypothetical protein